MNYEHKVSQYLTEKGFSFEDRHGYIQFNYTNTNGEFIDKNTHGIFETRF